MSDISTTLSMPSMLQGPSMFTSQELMYCSIFNLKMFLFVLMILICISCIFMSFNSLFVSSSDVSSSYNCKEEFGNDQFYSYKDAINKGYFTYQNIPLTSDHNLVFGQAKRYFHPQFISSSKPIYLLEVYANLYILDGNPFGKKSLEVDTSFKHKYIVYLHNTKTGEKENMGQLLRDNDGLYKLKFNSEDINKYGNFNQIEIAYQSPQGEKSIIKGNFTL